MDIGNKPTRLAVLLKYDSKCAYCGCDIDINTLSVDHIKPKRRGMDNTVHGECEIENFNPSCKSCNSSKSSMDLETWREEISYKLKRLKRDSSTYRCALKFGLIQETPNDILFHFEKSRKNG